MSVCLRLARFIEQQVQGHEWMRLSGIIFSASASRSALPLAKGWRGYGHSYGAPTFTVVNVLCVVEGLISHGARGHLATLPATCRPNKRD